MRKITLAMNQSLDGFTAGPNGEMDWVTRFDADSWRDISTSLQSVDTFLLGRVTYQQWAYIWPKVLKEQSSTPEENAFAKVADETNKIVFSRTLKDVDWVNTQIISGDIANEIMHLKQLSGKDISLIGGATLASSFISLGLIDEYSLVINPVILGAGKPLFKDDGIRKNLILIDSKSYPSGVVMLNYRQA